MDIWVSVPYRGFRFLTVCDCNLVEFADYSFRPLSGILVSNKMETPIQNWGQRRFRPLSGILVSNKEEKRNGL